MKIEATYKDYDRAHQKTVKHRGVVIHSGNPDNRANRRENESRQAALDRAVAKVARLARVEPVEGEHIADTHSRMIGAAYDLRKVNAITADECATVAQHFKAKRNTEREKQRAAKQATVTAAEVTTSPAQGLADVVR